MKFVQRNNEAFFLRWILKEVQLYTEIPLSCKNAKTLHQKLVLIPFINQFNEFSFIY